jgi:hypothetical protein
MNYGEILTQVQGSPQLQMALIILFFLMASLLGGIGRMIFLTFFTIRIAKMALFAGVGFTGYQIFM